MDASFSTTNQGGAPLSADAGAAVPGGVYLCQVGATVSCGACCGLYNVADASRPALTALLTRRTDRFQRVPRRMDAILAFADQTRAEEDPTRPHPDFHHCPYIGLIGDGRTRVGCLLHPLAAGNEGVDFRGLSYYGGMSCRIYFCPATHRLAARYKTLLRICFDDWYDYGLIVTERRLVAALLGALENRRQGILSPRTIARSAGQTAALTELLNIKRDWPYRHRRKGHLCHDLFRDRQKGSPAMGGCDAGGENDVYGIILCELESDLDNLGDAALARAEVDRRLDAALRRLGATGEREAGGPSAPCAI
jgi:hypothetical protein